MRRAHSRGAHAVGGLGGPAAQRATPAGTWVPAPGTRRPDGLLHGHVLSEAEFQQRILDYCQLRGLDVFFDVDSRKKRAGWPDLTIMSATCVLFRELKTEKGRLRPEQEKCIGRMHAAGLDVAVWRPSQWTTHVIPQLDAMRRPPRGDA